MADLEVYTGFWWNYSVDGLGSGVLTVPISSARYLISGLTLLVTLAGTAFWTIVAYVWHQWSVLPDGPVDYEHLQFQILLRNVSTPTTAIIHIIKIFLAWRKTGSPHRSPLFALVAVAALTVGLFGVASVFVGAIAASSSLDDILVLAKPVLCGSAIPIFNESSSAGAISTIYGRTVSSTLRSRAYAKAWYSESVSLATAAFSTFPVRRLPYTTSLVPCPFASARCRFNTHNTSDANTALALDTGLLDSRLHFGINGPIDRAVQFRRKATCMPIRDSDLLELHHNMGGTNYSVLRAGSYQGNPGNVTLVYDERMAEMTLGYVTGAVVYQPSESHINGNWQPISLFERNDSIVSLFNIVANSVNYPGLVDDPIFQASGVYTDTSDPSKTVYFADNFVTTLVCLDQFQFCNPQTGQCTAETYGNETMTLALRDLGLNMYQADVMLRIVSTISSALMYNTGPGNLGASGLLANEMLLRGGLSPALPPDQWVREVRLWFETALAITQERMLGLLDISGFNTTDGAYKIKPVAQRDRADREASEWECTSQKIRSRGQAQNFSVTGLIVIVVVAGTILLVGLLLEPFVWLVRGLRKYDRPAMVRQFARATDNLYWLLHAGLRGSGAAGYPWRYGASPPGNGVRDVEVPILGAETQIWPPVNEGDDSLAPFYRVSSSHLVSHTADGHETASSTQPGNRKEGPASVTVAKP